MCDRGKEAGRRPHELASLYSRVYDIRVYLPCPSNPRFCKTIPSNTHALRLLCVVRASKAPYLIVAWVPFLLVFSNCIGEWHMSHDACPWQILEKTHAECACLLSDGAAALPAHHPELGRADVVQEGLQADVAVAHELHEIGRCGDEGGHLGKRNRAQRKQRQC